MPVSGLQRGVPLLIEMAKPLTKRKDGAPYVRPREVEDAIDVALALDRQTQLQRATISSSASPDYLRDEVLLHLIREARRQGDKGAVNVLLGRLFGRCASKVRGDEELREESLRALGLLIAHDGGQDRLDFFECKFERAFSVLCKVARRDIAKSHSQLARDPKGEDEFSEHDLTRISQTALNPVEFGKLLAAIEGLEPELREAFVLVCIEEYKIESVNPTEVTAATLCRVEGRTIFNRVTKARRQLAEFLGDES